jgi:molybdopterin synthase sulfur carrier subunit
VPRLPADDRVVVVLPAVLMRLFPGCEREPMVRATSVREMVEALNARWPGMRDRLCDTTPRVRRHINIFVEGERATLDTPLAPGTEVFVMTAISGG